MKRIIQFKITDTGYACFEEGKNIFEISKTTLEFNVRDFYQAFYSEGKCFEDITLENSIKNDKAGSRMYESINSLIEKITPTRDTDRSGNQIGGYGIGALHERNE